MAKVTTDFVKEDYSIPELTQEYVNDTHTVGLWESEAVMARKYFPLGGRILDIGCGTGRTTFGLYEQGYRNIQGMDLTPAMIAEARNIAQQKQVPLKFKVGNILDIDFPDESFNGALFSFNGIMQVPGIGNRVKAMREVKRILTRGGVFFFTTHHSRALEGPFGDFWREEEQRWNEGKQDVRLIEFGDRIVTGHGKHKELFLHFPTDREVQDTIQEAGLELIEYVSREEIAQESEMVRSRSHPVMFWVTRKSS